MRIVLSLFLAFIIGHPLQAQLFDRYRPMLDSVAAHSPRVKALHATREAEEEGARQEAVPDDPTVEFGYLWGGDDHRVDFAVSQAFDFPTVYLHRRKAVQQEVANAGLRYRMALREVLLQAVQLCVEWETYDSLIVLTQRKCEYCEERMSALTTLYDEGAVNLIEHHRASRDVQRNRQELSRLQTERQAVIAELETIAGASVKELLVHPGDGGIQPGGMLPVQPSMEQQYAAGEVARAEAELKTVRSQWWPGLTLGYYSEKEPEQTFRGMKLGLSLPAWNNRHRTRQAKASLAAARYDAIDREAQLTQRIASLQMEWETYSLQANDTRRLLDEQDMASLLGTQLQEGVITRPTYLEGLMECMEDEKEWLQMRRLAQLKQAELESISFQPE